MNCEHEDGVAFNPEMGFYCKKCGAKASSENRTVWTSSEKNKEEEKALKYDSNKPDLSILPPAGLYGAAQVFSFGAQKYSKYNFMNGFAVSRLVSAALRHIMAWNWGEDKDPESKLSHLDHAICCLLMLRQTLEAGTATDDRYKQNKS